LRTYVGQETRFYVVEKKFWDSFAETPGKDHVVKPVIDNIQFIANDHHTRWSEEVCWQQDFVVVPKYVFKSLSKWYKCNKVIELKTTKTLKEITPNISTIATQPYRDNTIVDPGMYKGGYIQGQNTKQADLDSEQHGGEALPSAESYENTPIKETSMKMTSTPMNKKQKNVEVETETAKYDL